MERTINQTTEVFPMVRFQWKITRRRLFHKIHALVGFLVQLVIEEKLAATQCNINSPRLQLAATERCG